MTRRYDPERLREVLTPYHLRHAVRILPSRFASTPLGAVPAPSRFSDPSGTFTVLYVAESFQSAFLETLVRQRFTGTVRRTLPASELDGRSVAEISSISALRLLDLRGDGATRIGAPPGVVGDARHIASRTLSAALHESVPEADGIVYPSRLSHDPCVALYGRACGRLDPIGVHPLWEHADLASVLERYRIRVTVG